MAEFLTRLALFLIGWTILALFLIGWPLLAQFCSWPKIDVFFYHQRSEGPKQHGDDAIDDHCV